MEDVYVTGLVLRKINGVKRFRKYKFLVNLRQSENGGGGDSGGGGSGGGIIEMEMDEGDECEEVEKAILVHGVKEDKWWKVWRMLKNCKKGRWRR